MSELSHPARQVLRLGLDDWVPLWAVLDLVKREQPEDQLGALIATVRALLEQGLMLLGDLAAGPFEPWSGPTTQQLSRLEREWRRRGDGALLGIGLQDTAAGNRVASIESVD